MVYWGVLLTTVMKNKLKKPTVPTIRGGFMVQMYKIRVNFKGKPSKSR